jgi:hypothetical protein
MAGRSASCNRRCNKPVTLVRSGDRRRTGELFAVVRAHQASSEPHDKTDLAPVVALLLWACGPKSSYDPFVVPEGNVYGTAQVIAMAPFPEPADISVPDSILQILESLIDSTLSAGGFTTIPAEAFAKSWQAIVEELGRVYDPMTGRLDGEKYRVAEERLGRELSEQFDVDALMYPELVLADAAYADGVAKWDGASQSVASFWDHVGEALSALANGLSNVQHVSTYPSGTVSALSLRVALFSLDGSELYTNWGGIEIVADREDGGFLPDERRFREPQRIRRSVEMALRPLIERKVR